jgi:membrane protein
VHIDWKKIKDDVWRALPRPLRATLAIVIEAGERWNDVSGPQLGASIAFYTMFALAPLLVVAIAIVGAIFGADAARGQIVGEIDGLVGPVAAKAIEAMIEAAWREPGSLRAAILGVVTLLIGATGVFAELRRTLNLIGRVVPRRSVIGAILRVRLTAFALLLGFGFLSIASLLVSALLAGFGKFLVALSPWLAAVAALVDLSVSVGVLSVGFAALVRWLPDEPPTRRGVWISAISTAVLFTIGKSLIGFYLGRASVASSYGAAGSFVVLMLWVYYSSQILLYGAALGRICDEHAARRKLARKASPLASGHAAESSRV